MTVPVFEEYEPALDCPCAGCVERRRARARGLPVRDGGCRARRALALATAVGLAWGGGATAAVASPGGPVAEPAVPGVDTAAAATTDPDPEPPTPQGSSGPLHGGPGGGDSAPTLRQTTRAEIISRARKWVSAQVPYSMTKYWSDGYRQDCSGYVSMAWNLENNEWTGSLAQFGVKIGRDELQPGDILLFHNPADPSKGSHVTIFGGWSDPTHTTYLAYEQTPPHARSQSTPMAYWTNSAKYVPYRYKGLADEPTAAGPEATAATPYPGARSFGPGADNRYVTQLGAMLAARGGKRFYTTGPGPRWSDADRRATQAFQKAQGWTGGAADGIPGKATWDLLVNGKGKDIPPAAGATTAAPAFPGAAHFRPGASNPYVARLGRRLVEKGFGRYYTGDPDERWDESDRRNVAAFQKAQGWTGSAADGYPGPETWRRLFA